MASPSTNPKIEELRGRLKSDPKSRHFYPLAEELRKNGQLDEAEKILKTGLELHGSYLSAWMSMGRVLRELRKIGDAIESFKKALTIDPSNVVAARHLAECYLESGDKVEAIKKFKLVHALLPSDEGIEVQIDLLERELNPHKFLPAPVNEPLPAGEVSTSAFSEGASRSDEEPERLDRVEDQADSFVETRASEAALLVNAQNEVASLEAAEIASESTASGTELPGISESTLQEERDATLPAQPRNRDDEWIGASSNEPALITETETMAELYASQGHTDQAMAIYRQMLEREPGNEVARDRLADMSGIAPVTSAGAKGQNIAKVEHLKQWLQKVAGR